MSSCICDILFSIFNIGSITVYNSSIILSAESTLLIWRKYPSFASFASVMLPLSALSSPVSIFKSVVFPAPFTPTMATFSCSLTRKVASFIISLLPNDFDILVAFKIKQFASLLYNTHKYILYIQLNARVKNSGIICIDNYIDK